MIITVRSTKDIEAQLAILKENATHALAALRQLPEDPLDALAAIKFMPLGSHPLEWRALNLVEQVNQTFTYLVTLKAALLLLHWHPEARG